MGGFAKSSNYKSVAKQDIETVISDDDPAIKYYGLFNKLCWQLDQNGQIDPTTKSQYDLLSTEMDKNIVKAFDSELIKYQNRVKMN